MSTIVKTQSAFDKALADGALDIIIDSPAGVWIEVRAYGSATVRAYDSATVTAYGSATVRAYGSATVRAYGSATVRAYGSATVRAYGSATVHASGSATVRAFDSATVRAYGSATVRAYDSATVTAAKHVAVHLHSKRVTLDGGVAIDITDIDLDNPTDWCDYHGVNVTDGVATVYKAVDDDYFAGHNHKLTPYPLGGTVTAPDWRDDRECGHGLHFGYAPHIALSYFSDATRFLACEVDVATIIPLGDKIKAPTCRVVAEVDEHGRPVEATA